MPAKYRVEITPTAERDIEAVSGYIAQDSPENASAFIIALDRNISNFVETHCNASLPLRCPFIPENEILGTSYRHLLYGNYRTIFRTAGKTVIILRVMHGARLLDGSPFER